MAVPFLVLSRLLNALTLKLAIVSHTFLDMRDNKNKFIRAKKLIYHIPLELLDGIVCVP